MISYTVKEKVCILRIFWFKKSSYFLALCIALANESKPFLISGNYIDQGDGKR